MVYDLEAHQYRLTLAYVKEKLGVDLPEHVNTAPSDDPQKVAEHRLEEIADEIYSYPSVAAFPAALPFALPPWLFCFAMRSLRFSSLLFFLGRVD